MPEFYGYTSLMYLTMNLRFRNLMIHGISIGKEDTGFHFLGLMLVPVGVGRFACAYGAAPSSSPFKACFLLSLSFLQS